MDILTSRKLTHVSLTENQLNQVSGEVLSTASKALDITWTVKDGLLFHQIASLITAAVPTIFVYDGTSSPYKALQELASYQGVAPGQVLLIDRARGDEDYNACLDEAMEDGMWVVVSNCDTDVNFWTQISFKLYQLKLEATVHTNYRLFIIIKQAAADIVPGYMAQKYCYVHSMSHTHDWYFDGGDY